jgi:hypothetical protein
MDKLNKLDQQIHGNYNENKPMKYMQSYTSNGAKIYYYIYKGFCESGNNLKAMCKSLKEIKIANFLQKFPNVKIAKIKNYYRIISYGDKTIYVFKCDDCEYFDLSHIIYTYKLNMNIYEHNSTPVSYVGITKNKYGGYILRSLVDTINLINIMKYFKIYDESLFRSCIAKKNDDQLLKIYNVLIVDKTLYEYEYEFILEHMEKKHQSINNLLKNKYNTHIEQYKYEYNCGNIDATEYYNILSKNTDAFIIKIDAESKRYINEYKKFTKNIKHIYCNRWIINDPNKIYNIATIRDVSQ